MKLKAISFWTGLLTLAVVIAPLAAQACSGADKDENTSDSNLPEQTQTSVIVEQSSFPV